MERKAMWVCRRFLWSRELLRRAMLMVVVVAMGTRGVSSEVIFGSSVFPLQNCDFYFKGHKSVLPVFKLHREDNSTVSGGIISKDETAIKWAQTSNKCVFPAGSPPQLQQAEELCGRHFHVFDDKLSTTYMLSNITESCIQSLKGHHVVLPLLKVKLTDGTLLTPGDGNSRFPEMRRCLSFFTSSDLTTVISRMLNKEHRKKLHKIDLSVKQFRYDFNSLLNSILQFP